MWVKMEQDLINQLTQAIFRFKQIENTFRLLNPAAAQGTSLQIAPNVTMAEVAVLKGIKNHVFDSGEVTIPNFLCISRAAVSQMLGVMEQKGYITRNINKANRRKQSLSLTEKGSAVIEEQEHQFMKLLAKIVDRFGEKEMKQLIKLSSRFLDTIGKIKTEV
jgi:DNA-binding MarR family transcriptional regulator